MRSLSVAILVGSFCFPAHANASTMSGWTMRVHYTQAQLVQKSILTARSAWPNSPCKGKEIIEWNEKELRALYPSHKTMAMSYPATCTIILGNDAYGPLSLFCDTLTHELGHLAGFDHISQRQADRLSSRNPMIVMTTYPGHWKRCNI